MSVEIQVSSEKKYLIEEYEVVFVDKTGGVIRCQKCQCKTYVEDLGDGVVLEMVELPAGIFRMGTIGFGGYDDERPSRQVRVSQFLMGKYPVTQQQWKTVVKKDRSYRSRGQNQPVDRMSWKDADEFCKRLSRKVGKLYRLPSEAEWEYACRAGTGTPFHYGETITTEIANYVGEHTFQMEPKGIYRHKTMDVGSFPPNSFGLYDMHGGVWEWCADDWHDDYSGAPPDGSVWKNRDGLEYKVMRGGSWHEPPQNCQSTTRLRMKENEAEDYFGFRVALTNVNETQSAHHGKSNKIVEKMMNVFNKMIQDTRIRIQKI